MQRVDYHAAVTSRPAPETAQKQCLAKSARRWDAMIRRELHRLAQYLWPDTHLLGVVPIHSHRLRKRLESGKVVWWVERDVAPYDRYLCEAYRVELCLTESDQPQLLVRSGISTYPVTPISRESLKAALLRAGTDTPLVISRQFGPALDP